MSERLSIGLTCPACAAPIPAVEGVRFVACPSCRQRWLLTGERGVRRWQIARQITRDQAVQAARGFFVGLDKAMDLSRQAEITEVFLAYVPYWHVHATVAGWLLGRVKRDKDSTKPVEVEVFEEMEWADAAADVSEFGVQRVPLVEANFHPFDQEALQREGMVFEPAESPTDALDEARDNFTARGREKKSFSSISYEKFHLLRPHLSIVYYPLWIVRYRYRKRSYQIAVGGLQGRVLYGKAPGNLLYRAVMLVGGMAVGNLLLVHGTALALQILSSSDSSDHVGALLLLPIVGGIALMVGGYRAFRYGEEVEKIEASARKAESTRAKKSSHMTDSVLELASDLLEKS